MVVHSCIYIVYSKGPIPQYGDTGSLSENIVRNCKIILCDISYIVYRSKSKHLSGTQYCILL